MRLNPAWIFLLLMAVAVAFVVNTIPALPVLVATHFGFDGAPNGFATRDQYRIFILVLLIGLPALIAGTLIWLPKAYPTSLNIPHRDYWLAPQRASETYAFLRGHGFRLGSLLVWLIVGVHWLVLEANKTRPVHLPSGTLTLVLPLFLAGIALWIGALLMRFRKPPEPPFGRGL